MKVHDSVQVWADPQLTEQLCPQMSSQSQLYSS